MTVRGFDHIYTLHLIRYPHYAHFNMPVFLTLHMYSNSLMVNVMLKLTLDRSHPMISNDHTHPLTQKKHADSQWHIDRLDRSVLITLKSHLKTP